LIDRVVVTDGHVEIRYVIPTTSSSTKTRFCHLRTDYFDLVALAVAEPVKGRGATTTGTTTGPVGLLVIPLRDGVAEVAGPQRRPVGAAAVGLVGGQMVRLFAGPPTAAGPRHPHLVHQPDQLAGISVLARGQPGRQVAAPPIADRVELGGQPTP
jgi:hypothetical protein